MNKNFIYSGNKLKKVARGTLTWEETKHSHTHTHTLDSHLLKQATHTIYQCKRLYIQQTLVED